MRLHGNDLSMPGKAAHRAPPRLAAENLLVDAQHYFDKGEYRAAVIQLKNALNDNPDDAQSRLLLGKLYMMLDDGPSAVKVLQFAREKGLAREQWLISLGRAYLLPGSGKELLKEAVMRAPNLSEIRYYMAVAMQWNADTAGACRELGRQFDTDKEFESYKDAQNLARKVCLH